MKSVWTADSESSAWSSIAVLPRSVSTSQQPARESVLAMRSAGKCGSMGKYAPPTLKIASTAAIQSRLDRKSTRLNSSHLVISYAVFCLKKKKKVHAKIDVGKQLVISPLTYQPHIHE